MAMAATVDIIWLAFQGSLIAGLCTGLGGFALMMFLDATLG